MAFLDKFKTSTDIVKNIAIIGGITLAVVYILLSVIANFTEDRPPDSGLPKPPKASKAQWEVTVETTGQILYTNEYEHPADTYHILHNFYAVRDGKYRLFKDDFKMDEAIWGNIEVKKRG